MSEKIVLCVFREEPNIHKSGKTHVTETIIRKTLIKNPDACCAAVYLLSLISFLFLPTGG